MSVTFNCTYQSNLMPTPSVHWIFVNLTGFSVTLPGSRVTRVDDARDSNHLDIGTASRSDAGTYQCVVKNEFSMLSSSLATLTVNYFDGATLTALRDTTVHSGTIMTLRCTVSAVPPATEIRLSRSDGPFFSSSDSNLNRPLGTVTVNDANHTEYNVTADRSWNGTVSCFVRNPTHNDTSTVIITVLERPGPIIVSVKPICPDARLLIQWTVSGNGGRDITSYTSRWRRNATGPTWSNTTTMNVSDHHDSLTQQGGEYMLTGLESGKLYDIQVVAVNSIGSRESDIVRNTTLSVASKPVVVHNPVSITETTFELVWSVEHNGGAEIFTYTLIWSTDATFNGGYNLLALNVSAHANLTQQNGRWTITNLTKRTVYYMKVEANNCVGSSSSLVQNCSTQCYPGTPSRPEAVRNLNNLETSVLLRFEAPSDLGCGQITDYVVRDSDLGKLTSSPAVANGSVEIIITGLEPGKSYTVQVSAVNDHSGEGELSEPVTFTANGTASKSESGFSTTGIVLIAIFGGGGGVTGTVIFIYVIKKKKKSPSESSPVYKDHEDNPARDVKSPAPFYMTVTQQNAGGDKFKHTGSAETVVPETKGSKPCQRPLDIQLEFPREEDCQQRSEDSKSERETGAETRRSDDTSVMHESSAYGRVPGDVRNSDVRMQESNAYGVGMKKQPTNNVPMYEVVT